MKKRTLFLSIVLTIATFIIGTSPVSALIDSWVGGTIIVKWVDYGDPRGERPDSIDLVVGDRLYTNQHQTITLNVQDAQVTNNSKDKEFDSPVTEWKFSKGNYDTFFKHYGDKAGCLYEYSYIENLSDLGYAELDSHITGNLHPAKFSMSGTLLEDAGTLVITLIKDTLTTKNLTVKYIDGDLRDGNDVRKLEFAIRGENVADPIAQNAYYKFNIEPEDTIKIDGIRDTYTKSIIISASDAYQTGNPMIDYVFDEDTHNIDGRTINYEIDGNDILVTVDYRAKTKNVSIEIEWQDGEDKLGLRPSSLILKAYDQKGNLENTVSLSKDHNWITKETLYENMKHSDGTAIEYDMKIEDEGEYEYRTIKDGDNYKIIAKLKGHEDEGEKIIDDPKKENNPKTGIFMGQYILMFVISLVGLIGLFTSIKKD